MGSYPGGIKPGWDQESQAGACFVFPLFMEDIPRNLFYSSTSTAWRALPKKTGTIYEVRQINHHDPRHQQQQQQQQLVAGGRVVIMLAVVMVVAAACCGGDDGHRVSLLF